MKVPGMERWHWLQMPAVAQGAAPELPVERDLAVQEGSFITPKHI